MERGPRIADLVVQKGVPVMPNLPRSITLPLVLTIVTLIVLPAMNAVFAQQQAKPTIKHVPVVSTSAASGQEMFQAFCAVCHGPDAKGDGPAAPALKKQPADLTQLSKNNGGKFPETQVYDVIRGDTATPAHGSRDMPVWGRVFRSVSGSESMTHHRLATLTGYIKSLQR
jgi:hypothetical protein